MCAVLRLQGTPLRGKKKKTKKERMSTLNQGNSDDERELYVAQHNTTSPRHLAPPPRHATTPRRAPLGLHFILCRALAHLAC